MTTVAALLDRTDDAQQARWMPLTADEFMLLADMAKCLVVVDDMLIVFAGHESCPAAPCPTPFRCFDRGCSS